MIIMNLRSSTLKSLFLLFLFVILSFVVVAQEAIQLVGFEDQKSYCELKYSLEQTYSEKMLLKCELNWINKNGDEIKALDKCIELDIKTEPPGLLQSSPTTSNSLSELNYSLKRTDNSKDFTVHIQPKICKSGVNIRSGNKHEQQIRSIPEQVRFEINSLSNDGIIAADQIPDLVILNEKFEDVDSNNIINAGESSKLSFQVKNIGSGTAKDVKVNISTRSSTLGIYFSRVYELGDINKEEIRNVTIPLQTDRTLQSGILEFEIDVEEGRGFDAYPLSMKIETVEYYPPDVIVAEHVFSTDQGGEIEKNYPVNLTVLVKNKGKGKAEDHSIQFSFINPECLPLDSEKNEKVALKDLLPEETEKIIFKFTITRKYDSEDIPINIKIFNEESLLSYDTIVRAELGKDMVAERMVEITPIELTGLTNTQFSLTSTIDKNIPEQSTKKENRYALVIGNEEYSKYQNTLDHESNVAFARRDARVFKEYLINTIGVKDENLWLLIDATAGEIKQKVDLLSRLVKKVSETGEKAEIIFYYAGHGLPHEQTKKPYLIPVDVSGADLSYAIKLYDVIEDLGQSGAEKVIVFLDACFSGGSRNKELLASRGVRIAPEEEEIPDNVLIFSASKAEQSALPYNQEQHGLFTFYLLNAIQESSGKITYGDLYDQVKKQVSINSLKVNEKEQDPTIRVGKGIKDVWRDWGISE